MRGHEHATGLREVGGDRPTGAVPAEPDPLQTRATLLLRLNDPDGPVREVAWGEFHGRYAPMVERFARSLGAPAGTAEAAVQEVMVGFFSASPTFRYDPAKGRFRGYLMRCTTRAVRKQWRERLRNGVRGGGGGAALPLEWDEEDPRVVEAWEKAWQRERLPSDRTRRCEQAGASYRWYEAT